MIGQATIFTAFGVGPGPRQGKVLGPALGPVLFDFTLSVASGELDDQARVHWRLVQECEVSGFDGGEGKDAVSLRAFTRHNYCGQGQRAVLLICSALCWGTWFLMVGGLGFFSRLADLGWDRSRPYHPSYGHPECGSPMEMSNDFQSHPGPPFAFWMQNGSHGQCE